jgi:hypothetical protein
MMCSPGPQPGCLCRTPPPREPRLVAQRSTALVPELAAADPTGAVLFLRRADVQRGTSGPRDCFIRVEAGCVAVIIIEVDGPLLSRGNLIGVELRDCLNGGRTEVRASVIVNTTGPRHRAWLRNSSASLPRALFGSPSRSIWWCRRSAIPLPFPFGRRHMQGRRGGKRVRRALALAAACSARPTIRFSEDARALHPRETEVERFLSESERRMARAAPLTRARCPSAWCTPRLVPRRSLVPVEEPAFAWSATR